jgi:hypothetical protein
MKRFRFALVAAALAAGSTLFAGQQGRGATPAPWPLSNAIRERGSSVTGAYEGWFYNKDGSQSFLIGYFNRNTKQELDIPVGPNNRIEPGGPDFGQPTHFLAGRQWGVFAIKVPKDFGQNELTWTIVSNGQTNTITMHTRPDWIVEPFEDPANKNTPPVVAFERGGRTFAGPPAGVAASYTTTVGDTLPLVAWATDEGPKINVPDAAPSNRRGRGSSPPAFAAPPRLAVSWSLLRGPAGVVFENVKPSIEGDGKTTTAATFNAPGDYILRLQANDSTGDGGGGFQCCWTNVHVAVSVKPAPTTTR